MSVIFDVISHIAPAYSALSFSFASLFYSPLPSIGVGQELQCYCKPTKYVRIESQESFQTGKEVQILYHLSFFEISHHKL